MKSFLILTLLVASVAVSESQCVPTSKAARSETFATVKAVANQGEAGSELYFQEMGNRVSGTLRDYLGGGKELVAKLEGTLSQTSTGACTVHLSGKNKDGQLEIVGEITVTRFQGDVTRHLGKDVFSHALSLRRQLPRDSADVGL